MKKSLPLIRWLLAGVLTIAGLAWIFLYLKDMHPLGMKGTKLSADPMQGLAIRLNKATLVGRSEGEKIWEVKAETIDLSSNRRLATFNGISEGLLLQEGRKIASIKADKAVYNTYTRDVMTPGIAELDLVDGPSLKVKKVYWNSRKSRLFCEEGVEALINGSVMHGDRMIVDLEKKELTVSKVRGSIKLDEESP